MSSVNTAFIGDSTSQAGGPSTNMTSGDPASIDLTQLRHLPTANINSDNHTPISDSTSPAEVPSTAMNPNSQPSVGPPQAETPTPKESSHVIFVLSFDARTWQHRETTNEIKLLTGAFITTGKWPQNMNRTELQDIGVLGTFLSRVKAMKAGRDWLNSEVARVADGFQEWPLPAEMEYASERGIWKRSVWDKEADGSLSYKVTDNERCIALKVLVTETTLNEIDDEEGYETEPYPEEESGEEDAEQDEQDGGVEGGESDSEMDSEDEVSEDEVPEEGKAPAGIIGTQAPAA